MSFEIPEPGSAAMVDLLVRLEERLREEADAFVVVTVDVETGDVVHATGPFAEAEHALIEAGRQEADWKRCTGPDDGACRYVVVPIWEPSA